MSVQRGILFADSTRGAGLQFQTASGLYLSQSIYYDWDHMFTPHWSSVLLEGRLLPQAASRDDALRTCCARRRSRRRCGAGLAAIGSIPFA
ncbi:hypothetical protein [[Pseudomonas] boreopolis]|uniref:Uncharacterized protein n=1 Tax=Xanthomonas boreopolis TaxID=86183 RepID=A0A919KJH2_9XANT|nr:hypothetical protein GCM10009090_34270 [[Pseudomonas] boreopolis]